MIGHVQIYCEYYWRISYSVTIYVFLHFNENKPPSNCFLSFAKFHILYIIIYTPWPRFIEHDAFPLRSCVRFNEPHHFTKPRKTTRLKEKVNHDIFGYIFNTVLGCILAVVWFCGREVINILSIEKYLLTRDTRFINNIKRSKQIPQIL